MTCAHVIQQNSSKSHEPAQIQIECLAELYSRDDRHPITFDGASESQELQWEERKTRTLISISEILVCDPDLDVALLKLTSNVAIEGKPARVSFRTNLVDVKVRTFGFLLRDDPPVRAGTQGPGGKKKRSKTASDLSEKGEAAERCVRLVHGRHVQSKLQAPTPTPKGGLHFQLKSSGQIEPGFSGAPICDSTTGDVIGMVRLCDVNGAAPHAFGIPLEEIRKSIPQIDQLRSDLLREMLSVRLQANKNRFESKLKELLKQSPNVAQRLSAEIGGGDLSTIECPTTGVPEDGDVEVERVVAGLGRLFAEATCGPVYDAEMANLIVNIFMAYAPAEVWRHSQSTLQSVLARIQGVDDQDLVLPCDEVLLEVYMAAMDGRTAEYQLSPPSNGDSSNSSSVRQPGGTRGKNHIDLQPEMGIGSGSLPVEEIRNRIEPGGGLWRDARLTDDQKRQRFINHLKYLHTIGQTRYLSIVSETPSAAMFTPAQLIEFRNEFRYIAIVHLDSVNMSSRDQALIGPFVAGHLRSQKKP